jgi:hypothetical protein
LRSARDGDLETSLVGLRNASFPESIGRIGIVDEDPVADLVGWRLWPWLLSPRGQQALEFGPHLFERGAQVFEDMCGDPLTFDEQSQQQVLGTDIVMSHPARFLEGDLDDLLHARGWDDLVDDDALVASENRLDCLADLADLNTKVIEDFRGQPVTFAEQSKE